MLTDTLTFTILTCANCGVSFAITQSYAKHRRGDRRSFYCPNKHEQWFPGETDDAKIKRLTSRERHLSDQLEASGRSNSALKGVVTRKTNQLDRVQNGVCPHCDRSFQNLRAHMKTKHGED